MRHYKTSFHCGGIGYGPGRLSTLAPHSSPSSSQASVRINRSQFVFSSDSLIKFMLCFDPIFHLWEETHDREIALGGACAERWGILHRLTAKFVRHVSQIPIVVGNEGLHGEFMPFDLVSRSTASFAGRSGFGLGRVLFALVKSTSARRSA